MLNIEKYEEEIKKQILKDRDIPCIARELRDGDSGCGECRNCVTCGLEMLHWLLEEYKEPILDDKEKEYLSAVIKPFRKRIKSIKKTDYPSKSAFISIAMDKSEHIFLPVFELNNGMYQRMEINKEYTLEDLGL